MQIVVAPLDKHQQVLAAQHDASLSGEIRAPASHIRPMLLDERRIIGHRAMLEITQPHLLINLGIGMPEVCHYYMLCWWPVMSSTSSHQGAAQCRVHCLDWKPQKLGLRLHWRKVSAFHLGVHALAL